MNTHELAKLFLEKTEREIVASIDISTDDSDGFRRCFADEFCGIQWEGDGTVTLLFTGGYDNNDK